MKKLLIAGAGRSAWSLIQYLLKHSPQHDWQLTVADVLQENIDRVLPQGAEVTKLTLNVMHENERKAAIAGQDLVISLMPVSLHNLIAKDCLEQGVDLMTASYISEELQKMDPQVKGKNLLFLNEMGLDPGIDHMSAMHILHRLEDKGGKINAFRSFAGGLMAPESDDNPWHYKFTWNPYNVVRAGKGMAKYLADNSFRYLPYHRLFSETYPLTVPKAGEFEAYLNRDSLSYIKKYQLAGVQNFLRGTLRMPGFCRSWNHLVRLGLTNDTVVIPDSEGLNYLQYLELFLPPGHSEPKERLAALLGIEADGSELQKLQWLGLFDEINIDIEEATPAMILQSLLERKWKMRDDDKDRVVMIHEVEYEIEQKERLLQSVLDLRGENARETAMAKTVGLPLAIAARLRLEGRIRVSGVVAPLKPEIYNPVLRELRENGIGFKEYEEDKKPKL
ncbi:MAG: saccharopine dehydrogenase C-terminal domain-containing protein [Bacteroidia bacterium]